MGDIDTMLTRIMDRVYKSSLTDEHKASLCVQIEVGMRTLVWPILLSHVPSYLLDHAVLKRESLTVQQYAELIESSLSNPATSKELHDELIGALGEVEQVLIAKMPQGKV